MGMGVSWNVANIVVLFWFLQCPKAVPTTSSSPEAILLDHERHAYRTLGCSVPTGLPEETCEILHKQYGMHPLNRALGRNFWNTKFYYVLSQWPTQD